MSLVTSSISGPSYNPSSIDEKDGLGGFEFTKRKRWPQLLLQELVGSALFCLKPVAMAQQEPGDIAQGRRRVWKVSTCSASGPSAEARSCLWRLRLGRCWGRNRPRSRVETLSISSWVGGEVDSRLMGRSRPPASDHLPRFAHHPAHTQTPLDVEYY